MGFASFGKDLFAQNRSMRNRRMSVKEHPYFGKGKRHGTLNPYGEELKAWQQLKKARATRMRRYIFSFILLMMVLLALFVVLG